MPEQVLLCYNSMPESQTVRFCPAVDRGIRMSSIIPTSDDARTLESAERKYPSQDTEGLKYHGSRRSLVILAVIVSACAAGGALIQYLRVNEAGDLGVEAALYG